MKLTFEAFARPLFGLRYQGAVRALLVSGIVFFGLRLAGLRWSLPLPTLLSSGNSRDWGHPVAVFGRRGTLPPTGKSLYAARFLADLCVLLCRRPGQPYPAHQNGAPLGGPAAGFGLAACGPWGEPSLRGPRGSGHRRPLVQRTWVVGGLWAAAVAALLLLGGTGPGLFLGLAASSLLAGWCLWHTDGYAFLPAGGSPPAPAPVLWAAFPGALLWSGICCP